jgi:hypothetical protein
VNERALLWIVDFLAQDLVRHRRDITFTQE